MAEKKEDIKQLFEQFVDGGDAERSAKDIRKADEILAQLDANKPSDELTDRIKTKIDNALKNKRAAPVRWPRYAVAAAAAVVIAAVLIAASVFNAPESRTEPELISAAEWENAALKDDLTELGTLAQELEEIRNELLAIQSGEQINMQSERATELEEEMLEIEGDFWKG